MTFFAISCKFFFQILAYLEFRELLVIVLVYLTKCFNTARSLIYCIKFNLKDECCIWWNLALCDKGKICKDLESHMHLF